MDSNLHNNDDSAIIVLSSKALLNKNNLITKDMVSLDVICKFSLFNIHVILDSKCNFLCLIIIAHK